MTMATDRGTGSDEVRAELDEWVSTLNRTVARLYAEIERIRRGELEPLDSDPRGEGGPSDAAGRGSEGCG